MDVVTAPDRQALGQELADRVEGQAVAFEREVFPDGERYVRIDAELQGPVALVADAYTNDLLVETLVAADACREAGAQAVHLCVPYLAYARQDRAFHPGEAVSSRAINRALASAGETLVTVDVHAPAVLDHFQGPSHNALASEEIAEALGGFGAELILAPDAGALERAHEVAELLDLPFDHLEKTRISSTEVRMAPKKLDVNGLTAAIVDDIISTGGTMAMATGQLLEHGCQRVLVAATHGIFANEAEDRLDKAGVERILVTDTLPTERSEVTCAGALARGLRAVQAP
ncbi:MAG: ribose-phosphate diphosphokinase [Candidatus Thermoplasmatota archaeon]|nr:ribose-phosphate diphosphokinase [Candidatus Thermoplasmatota archaeon]